MRISSINENLDSLYVARLVSNYNKHAKKLQVTGGGIDNPDDEANNEDLPDQFMEFYIGATGPDDATPDHAKNLWGKILIAMLSTCTHYVRILADIERQFPFFPRLHAIIGCRPNHIPPAITTGVGPHGRRTVHYQAPEDDGSINQPEASGVFSTEVAQYNTFMDVMAAEQAGRLAISGTQPPETPSHDQENQPPPSTPTPRPALKRFVISEEAIAKAKASIRKTSSKPTIEETLLRIQKYGFYFLAYRDYLFFSRRNMSALRKKEETEVRIKDRRLLLQEFKLGIYTADEYRVKVGELEPKATGLRTRAASPVWDAEDGSLPSDDSDSDSDSDSS